MRINGYLGALSQKIDPAIRSGYLDFLQYISNPSIGLHFRSDLAIPLVHMRRNSVNSASGLKTAVIIVFSEHNFL